MIDIVGIRFKKSGKIYNFNSNGFILNCGDFAIVETARGVEFGKVAVSNREIDDKEVSSPLKPVIRIADELDKKINADNQKKAKDAFDICTEKIKEHKLDMKLVEAEYTFDNYKLIFCFTADGRIDFRDLVKDLAQVFKTRIELRQIGVRDQAKLVGGLGPCGQECCCNKFMSDFQPVSIKMAKEQGLSLNPTKISGLCGRLMCCLNYEQEGYKDSIKRMPNVGAKVKTPDGEGEVIDRNLIAYTLNVRVKIDDKTEEIKTYKEDEVKYVKQCQKRHFTKAGDVIDDELKKVLD